jgi:hypothetical protein
MGSSGAEGLARLYFGETTVPSRVLAFHKLWSAIVVREEDGADGYEHKHAEKVVESSGDPVRWWKDYFIV